MPRIPTHAKLTIPAIKVAQWLPEWEEVTTRIMDQTEAVVRGGVPPARALTALDRDVDHLLERRRYLLARRAAGSR